MQFKTRANVGVGCGVTTMFIASEDVQKFFDAFKVSPEPSAASDGAGGEPPPNQGGAAGAGPLQ